MVEPPLRRHHRSSVLPEIWNAEGDGDEARAKAWVEKAFEHVAGLPPKEPKVSKPRPKT